MTLCKFTGDTSKVKKVPVSGLRGHYYKQSFELVVFAGRTEMRAQLAWQDDVSAEVLFFWFQTSKSPSHRALKSG